MYTTIFVDFYLRGQSLIFDLLTSEEADACKQWYWAQFISINITQPRQITEYVQNFRMLLFVIVKSKS